MTALTKDRNTTRKATGQVRVLEVAAGVKIYAGGQVCINADGYAVPAADTAGLKFAGVSKQYVDNSAGANGAETVEVWRDGVFDFAAAGMGIDDIGKPVFVSDDQTVALSTTNAVGCGVISEVESATKVWVDIAQANTRTGKIQDAIASADGAAAAGANPTKAEFDAVVTLLNETKAAFNGLITKLKAARIIGS